MRLFAVLVDNEFNVKENKVLAESKEHSWFEQAHRRQHLSIASVIISTTKLAERNMKSQAFNRQGGSVVLNLLEKTLKIMMYLAYLRVLFMSL